VREHQYRTPSSNTPPKSTGHTRLSRTVKEVLINAYLEAYELDQPKVTAKNFLIPCLSKDKFIYELLYEIGRALDDEDSFLIQYSVTSMPWFYGGMHDLMILKEGGLRGSKSVKPQLKETSPWHKGISLTELPRSSSRTMKS
jgi:hypothetical protein